MGFLNKIYDHVINTTAGTVIQGARAGSKAGEKLGGDGGAIIGGLTGMFAGALAGGVRAISPIDMAESAFRSDEEIDERSERIFRNDF